MAEFAPGFEGGTDLRVLPKNTTPLTNSIVTDELLAETVGAAAGAAASASKSRRKHPDNVNEESVAEIESEALISRNTTSADLAAIEAKFTKKKPSFGFVRDLSGNGGPAFTRS